MPIRVSCLNAAIYICVLGLVMSVCARTANAQQSDRSHNTAARAADERSKVKLALDNFFAAAGKQDWDKVGRMLTEDFEVFTDEVTILNKYEYIKVLKQENLRVTQMQLKDLRIEVSEQGQMAWCRYHGFFHIFAGSESSFVETAETVVFRNENSGWKLVQSHASIKQRPWRDGADADSLLFRDGSNLPKNN
jgi:ketosteroid isomerase-like protein